MQKQINAVTLHLQENKYTRFYLQAFDVFVMNALICCVYNQVRGWGM